MIDALLIQTPDGFNITVSEGLIEMTAGIQTAVLLSLVGGNEDDARDDSTEHLQYWANFGETVEDRKLRSETLYLLNRLPVTSGNVAALEDAMNRDLAWLLASGIVSDLTTSGRISGPKRVEFTVETPEGTIKVSAPWLG
jgi:hypothetical protein